MLIAKRRRKRARRGFYLSAESLSFFFSSGVSEKQKERRRRADLKGFRPLLPSLLHLILTTKGKKEKMEGGKGRVSEHLSGIQRDPPPPPLVAESAGGSQRRNERCAIFFQDLSDLYLFPLPFLSRPSSSSSPQLPIAPLSGPFSLSLICIALTSLSLPHFFPFSAGRRKKRKKILSPRFWEGNWSEWCL